MSADTEVVTIEAFGQGTLTTTLIEGQSYWRESYSEIDVYDHNYSIRSRDWYQMPSDWATKNPYSKTATVLHVSIVVPYDSGTRKIYYRGRQVIDIRKADSIVQTVYLGDTLLFDKGSGTASAGTDDLAWRVAFSKSHDSGYYRYDGGYKTNLPGKDYMVIRGTMDPYTQESSYEAIDREYAYMRFMVEHRGGYSSGKTITPDAIESLSYWFTYEELPPWA